MAAYSWEALDAAGKRRRGVREADSPRMVRQYLRAQGLTPVAVDAAVKGTSRDGGRLARNARRAAPGVWAPRARSGELALITRQLATLLRAGIPLEQALHTVSAQSERSALRNLLASVRSRVAEGHALAAALGDFPRIFPAYYVATVAAGEQSGRLEKVLGRLADYVEQGQQTRQKALLALLYPLIVTVVAIVVVTALVAYVVPQVVQVFENIGQELPPLTRGLIAFSDFLQRDGALAGALIVVGIALFRLSLRRVAMRRAVHRLLLYIPLTSRLIRTLNTARFARTCGILLASSVSATEALRISAKVVNNLIMRESLEQAAERVREGGALHIALRESGWFPPIMLSLVASGEASGALAEMLERAAENQERAAATTIATLTGLFEPLLILVMGGVVLVIVLAILQPILDMNQLVR